MLGSVRSLGFMIWHLFSFAWPSVSAVCQTAEMGRHCHPPLYLTLASGALRTCGCDVSLHFEPQAVTAEDTVNMIQTLRDQTPSEFLGTVNREIKGRGLHRVALNTPCKLAGS